ncbi:hypothetical protein [Streptomyces sp. 8N616]|uniref:hypothetical protein n=1 Tax=Streptomyces sp. 8N616 TaxID=3457414 RepID=UPI003FD4B642
MGVDPDQPAGDLQDQLPTGTGTGEPALTPAAERALLAAHGRSRAVGSSYIGPEHIPSVDPDRRSAARAQPPQAARAADRPRDHRDGKEWPANRGQPAFGARPLRRTIQNELDNRLSNLLPEGAVNPGDTVVCDVRDGELACTLAAGEQGTEGAPPSPDAALTPFPGLVRKNASGAVPRGRATA